MPVPRVSDHRLLGGNVKKRQVVEIVHPAEFIVSADAFVHQRIGNGFDHIAVIVRTAEPFRRQHRRIHHDNAVEVSDVVLPHLFCFSECGETDFLVAGDMRIAEKGARSAGFIHRAGRIERILIECLFECLF